MENRWQNGTDGTTRRYALRDRPADRLHLEKTSSHITRSFKRGVLAVTRVRSDHPVPSRSIGRDEAYLIALVVREPLDPTVIGRSAHMLYFYLPRAVLCELAEQEGLHFTGTLNHRFATGQDDPTLRHLGAALLPALEQGDAVSHLFLDHILRAIAYHVLDRYGEIGSPVQRLANGGLAPLHLRRAKELMRAHLGSDISLHRLAEECGLSVTHFARAFRQSTGISPHRWLLERRVENAMALLLHGDRGLPDIALDCGFADQSHFTRTFSKYAGVSPGRWRRLQRAVVENASH